MHALTEICGAGKTSVLVSLLAHASREHYCALVDAGDSFDPQSGHAAGVDFSRLLWVRCGKNKARWGPLEQTFKVTDILLQGGGFGLVVADISDVPEKSIRRVPMSSWFRFSRVAETRPTALVFVTQQPHATSCVGMVLQLTAGPATFSGKLLKDVTWQVEVLRTREKKGVQSVTSDFSMKAPWA